MCLILSYSIIPCDGAHWHQIYNDTTSCCQLPTITKSQSQYKMSYHSLVMEFNCDTKLVMEPIMTLYRSQQFNVERVVLAKHS